VSERADVNEGVVVPRKLGNPKRGYISWHLNVPSSLARRIPDIEQLHFQPELTADGILYRPVRRLTSDVGEWLLPADSNQDRSQS
jgi:hypothetical protein